MAWAIDPEGGGREKAVAENLPRELVSTLITRVG